MPTSESVEHEETPYPRQVSSSERFSRAKETLKSRQRKYRGKSDLLIVSKELEGGAWGGGKSAGRDEEDDQKNEAIAPALASRCEGARTVRPLCMEANVEVGVDMFDEVDYEPDSDREDGRETKATGRKGVKPETGRATTSGKEDVCDKLILTGCPVGLTEEVRPSSNSISSRVIYRRDSRREA